MSEEKNNGLKIGIIFTISSYISIITFFIPLISIFPGILIEILISGIIPKDPYSNVGLTTIFILIILLSIFLVYSYKNVKKIALSKKALLKSEVISLMIMFAFIIHSLVMYVYWGAKLNFRSDGQLIFIVFNTYPISSFFFIIYGIFLDFIYDSFSKNKRYRTY